MLRFFRINDPYRLLGLLIILVILYMPFFLNWPGMTNPELKSVVIGEKIGDGAIPYTTLIESASPITNWFYGFVDLLFGRSMWIRHVLGFLILFSQSLFRKHIHTIVSVLVNSFFLFRCYYPFGRIIRFGVSVTSVEQPF